MLQHPKEFKDDQALKCRGIEAICCNIEAKKKSKGIYFVLNVY